MAGLQTLMQQGQMPGEAGMFSALPAQQGRNPVAFTKSLKQIPPEELIKIYNDPNDMRPKWAVASAYADAMKAKALRQGMQGQQAMAQNVAEQQKPPVADELMTRMAASGGEMKSYQLGGRIDADIDNLDEDVIAQLDPQFGGAAVTDAEDAARVEEKRREKIRQQFQAVRDFDSPVAAQRMLQEHPWLANEQKPRAAPSPAPAPGPAPAPAPAPVSGPRDEKPTERTMTGLGALSSKMTEYERLLEEAARKAQAAIRKRGQVTPEMQAAREQVEQARSLQMQQGQEDLRKIREEGVRQLQGRLDAARRPLLEDPEALLALAASINTERGQELGSLARGGAKVLAERRGRAEKAEEGITALSEKIRQLNAQYREAEALKAQRRLAQLTGDTEALRNADIAAEQLALDTRKTQAEIVIRMKDVEAKAESSAASREAAAASRAGTELNRLQLALGNRQKVYQDAKDEWAKRQDVKLAAMQASLPGAKPEDVNKWQQMQRDFDTAFRNSQEIRNLDAAIAQMGRAAGVPMPSGRMDTSGWGEVKVTDTPTQ